MKTKKINKTIIYLILIIGLISFASAQQPTLLSLQGKLTDSTTGAKIMSADLRVNINDSSGIVFNQNYSNAVSNGIFDLVLGSTYSLNLSFNEQYNLTVFVNNVTRVGGPFPFRGGQGQIGAGDIAETESYVFGKVNISDSLNVSGTVQATTFVGDGSLLSGIDTSFTNNTDINVTNFVANNTLFVNGSKVGIGTSSPREELTVVGNVSLSNSGDGIRFSDDSHMITAFLPKGYLQRARFTFNSTTSINISAGVYEVNGRLVEWDSDIEYSFTSLAASDWSYLYINDSKVTTGVDITSTELDDSITEPVWSNSKHGWYNGNDRAIFAVRTDGSSNILEFYNDGDYVTYADRINNRAQTTDITDEWVDVTLTAPKFSTKVESTFFLYYVSAWSYIYWRTNGAVASTGQWIGQAQNAVYDAITTTVMTDSSQTIEVKGNVVGTDLGVDTNGFYLPTGI